MRVHHVAIQVRDLERARAFYVGALGLLEVRRQPHSIWVDADGVILMLESCFGPEEPDAWKSDRAGLHLLALAMAPGDRVSWKARLAAAGVVIEAESDFSVYFRDPDGTRLAVSSYPEKSR
jgi:hypothetical protein